MHLYLFNREDKQAVVLISLDDCNAFKETAYLLKSPDNAKWLRDAIVQIESVQTISHSTLILKNESKFCQ